MSVRPTRALSNNSIMPELLFQRKVIMSELLAQRKLLESLETAQEIRHKELLSKLQMPRWIDINAVIDSIQNAYMVKRKGSKVKK